MTGDKALAAKPFDLDASFELKSSTYTLMTLAVTEPDAKRLVHLLRGKLAAAFFDGDLLVIDVSAVAGRLLEFRDIVACLKELNARPVAVSGASGAAQQKAAQEAGLAVLPAHAVSHSRQTAPEAAVESETSSSAAVQPELDLKPAEPSGAPRRLTKIIDRPVRTGQQIYARDADLVVLDSVAVGAELLADGSIHVYGPLRGRAHAGVSGDNEARIFARVMDPQLVSVAGIYRAIEETLPPTVLNKPAQVMLDGNKLVFVPLNT